MASESIWFPPVVKYIQEKDVFQGRMQTLAVDHKSEAGTEGSIMVAWSIPFFSPLQPTTN